MVKVLMCGNHSSNKGGMTSVINQIEAYDWNAEGIELEFVPTFLPGNPVKKGLFFCRAYGSIVLKMFFHRPDVVHMHMSYKGSFTRKWYLHRLGYFFKVKDIIHLHGSEFEKWYMGASEGKKKKIRRLLSECSSFIALGKEWRDVVLRIAPDAKVTVIENGIDIPETMVAWNDECCKILFLGVLIPRKGVSDLLQAIKQIKDRNKMGTIYFIIAGIGEEESKLKSMVSNLKLEDCVEFTGWVTGKTKQELLKNCQIMVSPSYNEGLPISILEAASYGMPIISTDVGDISSVVRDRQNGILIEPGDVCALADGILAVAEEKMFQKMSKESRRIIEESFSIQSFYSKLSEIYHCLGVK